MPPVDDLAASHAALKTRLSEMLQRAARLTKDRLEISC